MSVRVDFALVHQALLVIVKKLNGVLDGDHVLFTFAINFIEHGSERGGLAGSRGARHQDESAGLVAQALHDLRQSESVESLNFPRDGAEDGANRASLIENVAAKTRQVLQAK